MVKRFPFAQNDGCFLRCLVQENDGQLMCLGKKNPQNCSWKVNLAYLGYGPPVTVTIRIIIFLVGDPELNLHLPLLQGGGHPQGIPKFPPNSCMNLKGSLFLRIGGCFLVLVFVTPISFLYPSESLEMSYKNEACQKKIVMGILNHWIDGHGRHGIFCRYVRHS